MNLTKKKLDGYVKQLKSDLGILPYSDIGQPEKFASMTMKDVEDNINDFVEVIEEELSLLHNKEKDK